MSDIKTICPAEILKAYERTKITPIFQSWGFRNEQGEAIQACALSVLAVDQGYTDVPGSSGIDGARVRGFLSRKMELDPDYLQGVWHGFDGSPRLGGRSMSYLLGARTGLQTRLEILQSRPKSDPRFTREALEDLENEIAKRGVEEVGE